MLIATLMFAVASNSIRHNGYFTPRTTCRGGRVGPHSYQMNRSPELHWTGAPSGTQAFAAVMTDRDAAGKVQWVFYNFPAWQQPEIPEDGMIDVTAFPALNSWNVPAYVGPCPAPGRLHHYVITLYALDGVLHFAGPRLPSALQVLGAMQGHILDRAIVTGMFGARFVMHRP